MCHFCRMFIFAEMVAQMERGEEIRIERKKVLSWAKENLVGKSIPEHQTGKTIQFTVKGVKELVNQPHKYYQEKLEMILNLMEEYPNSIFVGESLDERREDYCYRYYRTVIAGEDSYFVVRENRITGLVDMYSIVDKIKE